MITGRWRCPRCGDTLAEENPAFTYTVAPFCACDLDNPCVMLPMRECGGYWLFVSVRLDS